MCGIAGFYGELLPGWAPAQIVEQMVAAIRHRGPDEAGNHIEPRIGLGHARLSIIDLSGGKQPLPNEDETVWVTFNGEIFNYVELQEELTGRGHTFRSHSDTEVIVHSYEELGADCVTRFNGDFAFAIWDRRRNRVVLARDRMGVRPIYYTVKDGVLAFASEVKALLEFPGVEAALDPIALDQCFTFWFPLAPRTPYKDIYEVPPGHVLIAEGDRIEVKPYWRLDYMPAGEHRGFNRSEADVAEELEALLIDATRIRLRADVPVGAYLSGGLDSSVTTALIKLFTKSKLRTFSVGFESAEFDETEFQLKMVEALGTDHSRSPAPAGTSVTAFPTSFATPSGPSSERRRPHFTCCPASCGRTGSRSS